MAGEVSVEVATDFPERFSPGQRLVWTRGGDRRDLTIAAVRPHADRLLVRFHGVDDVDAAREISGGDLSVPESEAVPPPEDFFYGHEVEGWTVEDPAGRTLGRAVRVDQTAGGPTLLVDTGGAEPAEVPFVRPIVVRVDRDARRIVLDPPEGLMDLGERGRPRRPP